MGKVFLIETVGFSPTEQLAASRRMTFDVTFLRRIKPPLVLCIKIRDMARQITAVERPAYAEIVFA